MERKTIREVKVYIIVIAFLFFLVLPRLPYITVENLVENTSNSISLAVISFLLIYALKAIVMVIPIPVLYIAAGIIFSLPWAIIITYLGLSVALSIGYLNGRRLGKEKVTDLINKHVKGKRILKKKTDNLDNLCFLSRLLPLPFDLLSMFYGAVKMPFKKYIIMSLLGVTPKVIPFILTSTHIANPLSFAFIAPFFLSLIVILVGMFTYNKRGEEQKIILHK